MQMHMYMAQCCSRAGTGAVSIWFGVERRISNLFNPIFVVGQTCSVFPRVMTLDRPGYQNQRTQSSPEAPMTLPPCLGIGSEDFTSTPWVHADPTTEMFPGQKHM